MLSDKRSLSYFKPCWFWGLLDNWDICSKIAPNWGRLQGLQMGTTTDELHFTKIRIYFKSRFRLERFQTLRTYYKGAMGVT